MRNFEQPGDIQPHVAPAGGVVSGGVYQIGQALVVALHAAAVGANFEGAVRGVFAITKVASQAWGIGDLVYWNDTAKNFTKTSLNNRLAGWAMSATGAGAGETAANVYLDGAARADSAT